MKQFDIMNKNLFNNIKLSQEEELCQHIINNIDDYIYGLEEIQKYIDYQNGECLYVHHTMTFDDVSNNKIIIKSDDHYGRLLCQYGGVILKPFYIMNDIDQQ